MLMLFSVLARTHLGGPPEYAALIGAGKLLVPLLFALTTLSLFISPLFWPALLAGFAHVPFAAFIIARGPVNSSTWFLGLAGLAALLFYILYTRLRK